MNYKNLLTKMQAIVSITYPWKHFLNDKISFGKRQTYIMAHSKRPHLPLQKTRRFKREKQQPYPASIFGRMYGTTGTRKRPVLVSAKTASFLKRITFCKGINE